jgi:hypothetical protein
MAITINKKVNLEASFEKLKQKLEATRDILDPFRTSNILTAAIKAHIEECTTNEDIPEDLFQQLGNYFKPE